MQIAEMRAVRSQASPQHRQWVLWDRIERRPTARTLSMFKTNTNEFIKKPWGSAVVRRWNALLDTGGGGLRVRASLVSLR